MNIKDSHHQEKSISTIPLFKSEQATVTAIQILQEGQLKEHVTKVPTFLICVVGKVIFENEKGAKETLLAGDYVNIEPMVKHWLNAITDSQLILFK